MQVVKTAYLRSPQEQYRVHTLYCHPRPDVLLPLSYYITIKTEVENSCTFRVDSLHKPLVCPAVIGLMSGTCTHFGIVT